jgi:hypothetical protein
MRFIIILLLIIPFSASASEDLQAFIKKQFPEAVITSSDTKYHYRFQYEIIIQQWLDHDDHSKGKFPQRIILSHYLKSAPMLMVTEGYNAGPRHYELSEILNSNQLIVEYRYFGKSKPADVDYQYLTNEQAMKDLHRINKAFKKYYRKEWISTGISKGGTTCMYYKATYPRDVKVAIPYVAPLPNAREDKRTEALIATIGDDGCRENLFAFQQHALSIQDSLLAFAQKDAKDNSLTFNRIEGVEKAIEYAVLEYTFSFWQMGHDCADIPSKKSAEATYESIKNIVGIDFYSDKVIEYYEPAFYQFMTENGYYGFMSEHLKDDLKHVTIYDNAIFAPRDVDLSYDPTYNIWVQKRLDRKAKRMLIIQGENDPWGALTYKPVNDKVKLFVKEGGSHRVRIKDFSKQEQRTIYNTLGEWLKAEVTPLKD